MLSRILSLAISSVVSLGIFAFFALRSGAISLPRVNPLVNVDADPLMTSKMAESAESTTVVHHRPAPHQSNVARPIDVTERQFDRLVSQGWVLVKFGAEWCGPCRQVVPELEQLASDNDDSLTVLMVDVDQEQNLARRYDVGSIPQMILFRDGSKVDQWTGFERASRMQMMIDRAKASTSKGQVTINPFAT